jgi:hypothetical protein
MPKTAAKQPAADHGPREQRHRVTIRDRGDPDNPNATIRRAEVRVIYHELWARGLLTDAQHEAADRLSIALECVEGGASGLAPGGGGSGPYGRMPMSARAMQAAEDDRRARALLSLAEYMVAADVCAFNHWPGYKHEDGLPPGGDIALRIILGKLAHMWGME